MLVPCFPEERKLKLNVGLPPCPSFLSSFPSFLYPDARFLLPTNPRRPLTSRPLIPTPADWWVGGGWVSLCNLTAHSQTSAPPIPLRLPPCPRSPAVLCVLQLSYPRLGPVRPTKFRGGWTPILALALDSRPRLPPLLPLLFFNNQPSFNDISLFFLLLPPPSSSSSS